MPRVVNFWSQTRRHQCYFESLGYEAHIDVEAMFKNKGLYSLQVDTPVLLVDPCAYFSNVQSIYFEVSYLNTAPSDINKDRQFSYY